MLISKAVEVLEDAISYSATHCSDGPTEEARARTFCAFLSGYLSNDFPDLAAAIEGHVFKLPANVDVKGGA